jgi:protein SCO1
MIVAALVLAALPSINVIDDAGRTRSTESWKGTPAIVVPIFTRCPLACPMIIGGVKRAAAKAKADAASYRVIVFSFDPRDTPADLHAFRERHHLPLAWTVASASPQDTHRLLDALGVRVAEAKRTFVHPNVIVALTPELKPVKHLYGTEYDVDAALAVARGGTDWVGRYGAFALAALILAATLAGVAIVHFIAAS